MNILITISDSYAPWAAAMLQSMVDNNTDLELAFYIIAPDISEVNKTKLNEQFAVKENCKIYFPIISDEIKEEINGMNHYLLSCFNTSYIMRLYAPRILPNNINKILYLDTDILITESIKELETIEFNEHIALAAVKDLTRHDDYKRLGIDETKHIYFNSGVMLLNLTYWREHSIGQKCLDLLVKHSIQYKFPDQDALNVACEGRVIYLHPRYNCITSFFAQREFIEARVREEEIANVIEATRNPAIVHFTWPSKPWHKGGFVPKRELWMQALSKTTYRNSSIKYKDGIKGRLRHYIKNFASYTLPLFGMQLKSDIYQKRRYKHIYWLSILLYYGFAQYLPNFDSRFFGKFSNKIRVFLVKNIFDYVGQGVNIGKKARFGNGKYVRIGSRSNIGENCQIPANMIIGRDVMMGPNNFFFGNFTHNISDVTKAMIDQGFKFIDGHTEICNDVWIGRDCLFMPCIKVGEHSVVGARSVVTKNIPDRVIVGGNPAKIIKERK